MRSRTYRFTEKDPVCGEIMNMVEQRGLRGKQHTGKIAILATKAKATIDGILYGDTKRPQNATVTGRWRPRLSIPSPTAACGASRCRANGAVPRSPPPPWPR